MYVNMNAVVLIAYTLTAIIPPCAPLKCLQSMPDKDVVTTCDPTMFDSCMVEMQIAEATVNRTCASTKMCNSVPRALNHCQKHNFIQNLISHNITEFVCCCKTGNVPCRI